MSSATITGREPADPDGIADVFDSERIAPEMFHVESWSGSEYTVDMRNPACTCADFEHRQRVCKHISHCKLEQLRESLHQ